MSKKTRYVLGRVAAAVALVTASSLASAANCSTSYCFVDGAMKWTSSQDLESIDDLYGITSSTPSGATTTILAGSTGDQGYVENIYTNKITKVNFSKPDRISTAWAQDSGITFKRPQNPTPKLITIKNITVKLQSAPSIVSINSDFQSSTTTSLNFSTFWNLNGSGTDFLPGGGPSTGDGSIPATLESDGYYHARVVVPMFGLIGVATSTTPYATGALREWWSGLGIVSKVFSEVEESSPFGRLELDMRFSKL